MGRIEILPVDGLLRFATFCKLPRLLYSGMPGFAAPLDVVRWTLFSHRLNPHYRLVEDQKFLARRDGKWVGRISAQVYRDITPVGASPAQFGALDAVDDIDVVRALTEAAERWLRARGADRINGPFSPTINGECGLLVDGFEAMPMIFMPWHPPWLSRHLDALGYEKARDLISYHYDRAEHEEDLAGRPRILNRREWRDRLKLRQLDKKRLKTVETPLLEALFNDAWGGNWGFVPFVLLGMIEEMRRRGAAASLNHLEAGWVLEDNIAMRRPIEMFGGAVDKIHRIYEKSLQGAFA